MDKIKSLKLLLKWQDLFTSLSKCNKTDSRAEGKQANTLPAAASSNDTRTRCSLWSWQLEIIIKLGLSYKIYKTRNRIHRHIKTCHIFSQYWWSRLLKLNIEFLKIATFRRYRNRASQMMPYWASSCSSRWLYASHGQITVMSKRENTHQKNSGVMCFGHIMAWPFFFYSPVPRPSIPGISSPKLVRKEKKNLYWRKFCKLRWLVRAYQRQTYPITPLLGGLLLNCREFLCLNLGAGLRGVPGPVALRGALLPVFPSGLATSKFMLSLFWLEKNSHKIFKTTEEIHSYSKRKCAHVTCAHDPVKLQSAFIIRLQWGCAEAASRFTQTIACLSVFMFHYALCIYIIRWTLLYLIDRAIQAYAIN